MPRLRLPIAILAAALVLLASGGRAHAQMPPYTAYGMGLRSGDVVTASTEGVECGRATVSAAGNWKISIPADAPCHPSDGATVRFAVNGREHTATVRWSGGGAPLNPRIGVALGAPATPAPTATPMKTPLPKATSTPKAATTPTAKAVPKAKATPKAPRRG